MTESVSEKVARFEKALQLFIERVRADTNLLAAVLVGSLTEETVWRRDAISLWLIEKDGVTKRLRADGEDPRVFRTLVEAGVNVHVELIPRSRFKRSAMLVVSSVLLGYTRAAATFQSCSPHFDVLSVQVSRWRP